MSNALIPAAELDRQARMVINSGLVKDTRNLDAIKVKIAFGAPYGLSPMACLNNLYLGVGGKPGITMSAACMQGLAIKAGYLFIQGKHDNAICEVTVKKLVAGQLVTLGTSSFGKADAEAAGLTKNDTYKKYARNMYWARASANAVRWFCPDVLNGTVHTPDEVAPEADYAVNDNGDLIPQEGNGPTVLPLPPAKATELRSLLEKTQTDAEKLLAYYGKPRIDDLSSDDADDAIGKLNAKLAAI